MRPMALKWRLSILVALVIAATLAAVSAIARRETEELALRQLDQSLLTTAQGIRAIMLDPTLERDRDKVVQHLLEADARRTPLWIRAWGDNVTSDLLAAGGAQAQSMLVRHVGELRVPTRSLPRWCDFAVGGDPYRLLWLREQGPAGPLNVAVAGSTRYVHGELDELASSLLFVSALVVAGLIVVSVVFVVLGLRPIRRTARQLLSVTAANVEDVEFRSDRVPAELRPFVEAVSQVLHRLAEAIRRQKAFVADASHELRTPLTVAKSTIELSLLKKRSAAEYRRALVETDEDLGRLERLVDELLTLARLDGSTGLSDARPVDLDALLAELAARFSSRVEASGGKLTYRGASAHVMGNRGQLERLFTNLLDNAIRHGPAGGDIELRLESSAWPGAGGFPSGRRRGMGIPRRSAADGTSTQESACAAGAMLGGSAAGDVPGSPTASVGSVGEEMPTVLVTVKDQGGRIASADLPHLFDRFYRADGSRSQATGGHGLGLAIAREVVLRHDGQIAVVSDPEFGTRVRVRLPLYRGEENRLITRGNR